MRSHVPSHTHRHLDNRALSQQDRASDRNQSRISIAHSLAQISCLRTCNSHIEPYHTVNLRRSLHPLQASTRCQIAPLTDLCIAPCCALHLSQLLALPIAIFPDLDLPLLIHPHSCFEILWHLIHLLDFICAFPHPFPSCSTQLFPAARLPSLSSLLAL
jgi:hypothetical protein